MRLLGAILAGGRSRRFGSDKAIASVDGQSLMAHAVAALSPQVEAVVSCGREWPGLAMLADRPAPDLGPLGGLNAALRGACEQGYDGVLSVSVDSYPIPRDLAVRLQGNGPLYLDQQYLLARWPSALGTLLDAHLAAGRRSVRSWIDTSGAIAVDAGDLVIHNLNTPDALALVAMANTGLPKSTKRRKSRVL